MNGVANSPAICVLGMHRSGTSCVTGLLEDAGVFLGEVHKQNPYNKKGNQEKQAIMDLHNEVLAANGGAWDRPPSGPVVWSAAQKARLKEILSHYDGHARWAFKDPRSLFTLSAWQEALPGLAYLGTFRHPGAVAQSLHRRSKMPAERGFTLWQRYNEKLLEYQGRHRFDLLCFDLAPADYMRSVAAAFKRLGLDASHTQLAFFEEQLRNTDIEPQFAEPPAEIRKLYQHLKEVTA